MKMVKSWVKTTILAVSTIETARGGSLQLLCFFSEGVWRVLSVGIEIKSRAAKQQWNELDNACLSFTSSLVKTRTTFC